MTNISKTLQDYFDALERLKINRPIRAPKDLRITNDLVALEAGRKKGSIKKSRQSFLTLIDAISAAAAASGEAQSLQSRGMRQNLRTEKYKAQAQKYRVEAEAALASLVSRLYEIHELKKKILVLEGNVENLNKLLSRTSNTNVVTMQQDERTR